MSLSRFSASRCMLLAWWHVSSLSRPDLQNLQYFKPKQKMALKNAKVLE